MKPFLLALLLLGLAWPAGAQETVSFEAALKQYTRDGVLDGQEYAYLKGLNTSRMSPSDRRLAEHFLSFAAKHSSYTRMSYAYQRTSHSTVTLHFIFAPTYAEDSALNGQSVREVLGLISQNDALPETHEDDHRCGAAALLSAHFLLYGSLDKAFASLQMPQVVPLTYRSIHLAQERLYLRANRDGKPGLVTQFKYRIYSDGHIDQVQSEGEIRAGADLLGMRVHPLLGPRKDELYRREQTIRAYWRMYPEAPMLVGVYLNQKTGAVHPVDERTYPQNHFVLIFRDHNRTWMLNSGVLDNGNGSALSELSPQQVKAFLYFTHGSIDALTRS